MTDAVFHVRALHAQGFSVRQIRVRTGLNRNVIGKAIRKQPDFDEWGRDRALLAAGQIKMAVGCE